MISKHIIFYLFIKLSQKLRNVYENTSTTLFLYILPPSIENNIKFLARIQYRSSWSMDNNCKNAGYTFVPMKRIT